MIGVGPVSEIHGLKREHRVSQRAHNCAPGRGGQQRAPAFAPPTTTPPQTLQALKHLHDLNIAHRDLKPENILFTEMGTGIKLIDFGMSKIVPSSNALMNTKLGTPYYVSPEVLDGKYDKRCDLWSIGVITFVCICGEPPFVGKTTADLF